MNSYRAKKEDSDHSDQEEPLPENANDDYEPRQKRATIWSDIQMERQLNFKGAKINLDKGNPEKRMQRVCRGAETYELPLEETIPKAKVEIPIVTVTPVSDGPFGEYVDLSTVEEFGVGPSSGPRVKPNFRRGRGRGGYQQKTNTDASMDTSNDVQDGQADNGPAKSNSNNWMRGRGRGRYWQNRGRGTRGRGGFFPGQKRNYDGNAKTLVAKDYSLETLMSAEFQHGIPLDQLGQEVAQALGEKDPKTVLKIIEAIGEEKALQLLEETREIESKGGMKTLDGSRRRTPGGVFISLFKSDADVSTDVKDKIFEESRAEFKRNYKVAKRRNFESKMKEVADLMKMKREEESELKPLEAREDIIVEDLPTTDEAAVKDDAAKMEP